MRAKSAKNRRFYFRGIFDFKTVFIQCAKPVEGQFLTEILIRYDLVEKFMKFFLGHAVLLPLHLSSLPLG